MQRAVRAIFGVSLVAVTVAACNDDPLSADRDKAVFFQLDPSVVTVNAGATAKAAAVIVNKYGASTFSAVTAEPCDAKITAVRDTSRNDYQPPERFVVSAGNALGASCLIVKSEGVTDTITVRVVPATIRIVGDSVLPSGAQTSFTVQFLNAAGAAATGMSASDVTFTISSATNGVFSGNTISAQAPGTATITASLKSGATRTATKVVTVVAGTFAGTTTPAAPYEGSVMTINAPAGLQYDADTQVLVGGVAWPWVLARAPTGVTLAAPATRNVVISNIGANQVALNATLPIVSHEPADNDVGTARVLNEVADSMWFSVSGTDDLDLAKIVTTGGNYRFTLDWNPASTGSDMDVIFFDATGGFMGYSGTWGGCATGSRPEGCTVAIPAGTYFVGVNWYDGDATTTKLVVKKQ